MKFDPDARVLIVADDLTGALDTAGPFADSGLVTKVVAQPQDSDAAEVGDAQVVSINTASRHLPAPDAARRVEECVGRYAGQRFDIVFKKIDSTLRGNVAAETIALMRTCRRGSALVAPAFPAQGRTVIDGVVHVEGVPLAQTGFAHDALSPPPLQPLGAVFADMVGRGAVSAWRRGQELPGRESGIVVADAVGEDDMLEVCERVAGCTDDMLLVGSAGLGTVLAHGLRSKRSVGRQVGPVSGPLVFVVGSRAARSREQVAFLRTQPGTVVLEAPNGVLESPASAAGAAQAVVLAVEDPDAGVADAGEVARRMSRAGLEVAAAVAADVVVVTGGDTAIALLEASGCAVIEVCGNLMPGIPYARFSWQGKTRYLVTKAGGFGTADTMVDIVRRFRERASGAAPMAQ